MMVRTCLLSLALAAGTAQAQPGPHSGHVAGHQGGQSAAKSGGRSGNPANRSDRAGPARMTMGLVDYFDYPMPSELEQQADVMIGMGNDALWECQMGRAARIAETVAVNGAGTVLR